MKWFIIDKSSSIQPAKGDYNDWKEQIAKECNNQCIYCAIHESQFGGQRNYHVEHYKPKSLLRFKSLSKDIKNLYYSCAICNTFKGNDWPNDWSSGSSEISYPDPSAYDYSLLFSIDSNFSLSGTNIIGRYILNKLHLNRVQLILERRAYYLSKRHNNLLSEMFSLVQEVMETTDLDKNKNLLSEFLLLLSEFNKLEELRISVRPYTASDVRK